MRILIADDEVDFLDIMKESLERKGHDVDTAQDGAEVLRCLKHHKYDIAFLDHNMPELTGLEVIKHIKENKIDTITVMITGYPSMKDFFAKTLGADEYLDKPCELEDIYAIIEKYEKKHDA